jgi:RNA recognition motif-containing protein
LFSVGQEATPICISCHRAYFGVLFSKCDTFGDIDMDIYVGNLPYQVDDVQLQDMFSQYGNVTSARVITDRSTGQSKGFGFVEMPDKTEALAAIEATNDQDCNGRNLRVNESQPKPRGGGGGGGGRGGGYGGGGGGGGGRW